MAEGLVEERPVLHVTDGISEDLKYLLDHISFARPVAHQYSKNWTVLQNISDSSEVYEGGGCFSRGWLASYSKEKREAANDAEARCSGIYGGTLTPLIKAVEEQLDEELVPDSQKAAIILALCGYRSEDNILAQSQKIFEEIQELEKTLQPGTRIIIRNSLVEITDGQLEFEFSKGKYGRTDLGIFIKSGTGFTIVRTGSFDSHILKPICQEPITLLKVRPGDSLQESLSSSLQVVTEKTKFGEDRGRSYQMLAKFAARQLGIGSIVREVIRSEQEASQLVDTLIDTAFLRLTKQAAGSNERLAVRENNNGQLELHIGKIDLRLLGALFGYFDISPETLEIALERRLNELEDEIIHSENRGSQEYMAVLVGRKRLKPMLLEMFHENL